MSTKHPPHNGLQLAHSEQLELVTDDMYFPAKLGNKVLRFVSNQRDEQGHVKSSTASYQSIYSIKYVIDGHEEYTINGYHKRLHAGDTMLVNNHSDVEVRCSADCFSVFIDERVIGALSEALFDQQPTINRLSEAHCLPIQSERMNRFWRQLMSQPQLVLSEELYLELGMVLITAFITPKETWNKLACKQRSTSDRIKTKLDEAKEFIYAHANGPLNLDQVANHVGISKYLLLRQFNQLHGITPIRLHTWLRHIRAKDLIQNHGANLTEVAELLSYPDVFTFSKQFKRLSGMKPSDLKKQ